MRHKIKESDSDLIPYHLHGYEFIPHEKGIQHYFIEDESDRVMRQVLESIEYLRTLEF